jgi:hypothetical protein
MVSKKIDERDQFESFKRVASDLGLAGDDTESLDRIMGKLDLTKKPEPAPKPDKK